MVTITQERIWSCRRDRWRLDVFDTQTESEGRLVSIQGRQEIGRRFWSPVVMDVGALAHFGASLLSAVTVVAGFQAIGVSDSNCPPATRLHLAKCCGAFYELEIYGTVIGGRLKSAELRAVLPAAGRRPVIQVRDRDIEAICADLATALASMGD